MIRIDHGKVAEYAFASELLARGVTPNWPSSQNLPYDMIADTGSARHRVQVKGTIKSGQVIDVQFMCQDGKKKRRYRKDEVDFIALHIRAFETWYIFPVDDIETGARIKPGDETCKYNIYREAWNLLLDTGREAELTSRYED